MLKTFLKIIVVCSLDAESKINRPSNIKQFFKPIPRISIFHQKVLFSGRLLEKYRKYILRTFSL